MFHGSFWQLYTMNVILMDNFEKLSDSAPENIVETSFPGDKKHQEAFKKDLWASAFKKVSNCLSMTIEQLAALLNISTQDFKGRVEDQIAKLENEMQCKMDGTNLKSKETKKATKIAQKVL